MASTSARSGDKKDTWPIQAAASLGGGQKASLSRSEEFLTRISTELTDEALFTARSHMNPMPDKEKQTKDQGTQISRHGELSPSSSRDQSPTHLQP
ncbi:rCG40276 [Rattus norvegicus]|uniref:RCG40276 n=1 Tax=Rattus norvegicus TaxID=10116 RepID=A6I9J5_RAT|nr:rCG40276 [Rattus norvegicus]